MSLMSLISGNASSQSNTPTISPAVSAALAKLQDAAGKSATATPNTGGDGVTISAAAQAAAAEKADNAKDFTALATETRADLDAQYAAQKAKGQDAKPDFSGMSGRALSAVVLNQGGTFTRTEQRLAKAALDQQTRADFTSSVSTGMSMGALSSYSQSLVQQYDAMSPEERQARGWTPQFRDSAAAVVTNGSLSLFDQIGD